MSAHAARALEQVKMVGTYSRHVSYVPWTDSFQGPIYALWSCLLH